MGCAGMTFAPAIPLLVWNWAAAFLIAPAGRGGAYDNA